MPLKTAFLFVAFSIAFAAAGFGQYQSFFGTESTRWNLKNSIFTEEGGSIDSLAYIGDTLYADNVYSRYERWSYAASFDPDEEPPVDTEFESSENEFWLRESTDASMFYIGTFETGGTPEIHLACNMDLETGQSFQGISVTSVSTDAEGRKVVSLQDGAIEFVEGVGPIPFLIDNALSGIICQVKDDEISYLTPEEEYTSFCRNEPLTVDVDNTSQAEFRIYPNPAAANVVIETRGAASGAYTLHDLLGTAVLRGNINGNRTELSVTHLPKGMYLLRLETGGVSAVKKLVLR